MTCTVNILAAGEELFNVIVVLALVAISAIVGMVQKAKRKQQQDRQAQQQHERRPPVDQDRQAPAARPQPPKRVPAEQLAEAMRQALGIEILPEEPRPPQPVAEAPPKPPRPQRPRRKLKRRRAAPETPEQRLRSDELGELKDRHMAVGARGLLTPASMQPTAPGRREVITVDLSEIQQARRAILYHEIFSPPKALREGQEMWDM